MVRPVMTSPFSPRYTARVQASVLWLIDNDKAISKKIADRCFICMMCIVEVDIYR